MVANERISYANEKIEWVVKDAVRVKKMNEFDCIFGDRSTTFFFSSCCCCCCCCKETFVVVVNQVGQGFGPTLILSAPKNCMSPTLLASTPQKMNPKNCMSQTLLTKPNNCRNCMSQTLLTKPNNCRKRGLPLWVQCVF